MFNKNEIKNLKDRIEERDLKIRALEREKLSLMQQNLAYEDMQKGIKERYKEVDSCQDTIAKLKSSNEDTEKRAWEAIDVLETKIETLEKQLRNSMATNRRLREKGRKLAKKSQISEQTKV